MSLLQFPPQTNQSLNMKETEKGTRGFTMHRFLSLAKVKGQTCVGLKLSVKYRGIRSSHGRLKRDHVHLIGIVTK